MYKQSRAMLTLVASLKRVKQNEGEIQRMSGAIDREWYRVIQRACPTLCESLRLDSKSWQERKSEIG